MAGSYRHCTNDDGSFRSEDFSDLIENLGDAYEACEMMHWMIGYLAGGDKQKIEDAEHAFYTRTRREELG